MNDSKCHSYPSNSCKLAALCQRVRLNIHLVKLSFLLVFLLSLCPIRSVESAPQVTLLHLPADGCQPQAVVDTEGILHLLYFKGDPAHGDLYYVTRTPGNDSAFSPALKVNNLAASAVARGGIRGGQLALGKDKQVLVAWNAPDHKGIYFSRLNATKDAFEPQRNLLPNTLEIDGGGTIAADSKGNVYVLWHSVNEGEDESAGRIYMKISNDGGETFSSAKCVDCPASGTCSCCSMKALADDQGHIYVLYRAAGQNIHRDTTLLTCNNTSCDKAQSYSSKRLQGWQINACPLTMFALANTVDGIFAGWETQGKVNFRLANCDDTKTLSFGVSAKYPVIAANQHGDLLFSWTEQPGGESGATANWQLCNHDGNLEAKLGSQPGIKKWSFSAAVSQPNGDFLLIY